METTARLFRFLLVVVAMLWAQPANATFHLWVMTEIYSNGSGAVQYIVLQAAAGFQQFVAGHEITTTSPGGDSHTFIFPNDLPDDTTNRTLLIGTEGFASLGIVAPDYVVPNGFLFLPGGTITWAGIYDTIMYGALPTDGIHAIDRNGSIVATAPTNFAGATGAIVDCMFNWGERTFPQYFAPAGAVSAKFPPYYFRFYPPATYLATSSADDHIWVQSPVLTGNLPQDIAPIATYLAPSGCSP
jgi:hypothetical protein